MSDDSRPNRPSLLAPPSVPEGAELVMRVMPLPADVNANGDIFGGW
ncbi:MAG TPA: acyl-CoA thioesterase, partial [Rubrivivax sp.]|nr:acyl-CoA thioesterase [Rubrivivax sp.]